MTGAASGLGRSTARLLAGGGARVILVDIDEARLRQASEDIGGEYRCRDVGDPQTWAEMARLAPTIAVINAGVVSDAGLLGTSAANYARMKAVNVDQAVYALQALLPGMHVRGEGRIVVVASVAGVVPTGHSLYSMTKHALVGLVRAASIEFAGTGVTINCLCPGLMDTPIARRGIERAIAEGRQAQIVPLAEAAEQVVRLLGERRTGRVVAFPRGDRPVIDIEPPDLGYERNGPVKGPQRTGECDG